MYADRPDPVIGACPADDVPVYRMWDACADTNHRYTADAAASAAQRMRSSLVRIPPSPPHQG
jgi:hypothetical protein